MRRLLAIVLLGVLGLALPASAAIPLLTGGQSSLPACCRAHGVHRCVLTTAAHTLQAQTGAQLTAAGCPFAHAQRAALTGFAVAGHPIIRKISLASAPLRAWAPSQPRAPGPVTLLLPRAPPFIPPSC